MRCLTILLKLLTADYGCKASDMLLRNTQTKNSLLGKFPSKTCYSKEYFFNKRVNGHGFWSASYRALAGARNLAETSQQFNKQNYISFVFIYYLLKILHLGTGSHRELFMLTFNFIHICLKLTKPTYIYVLRMVL